jgi:hypothetical protein
VVTNTGDGNYGIIMKKSLIVGLSVLALSFTSQTAFAKKEGKEVTIKGEAECAKCALHQSDKCATAIVTKKNGKEVTYYVVDNDASKKGLPHTEICKENKQVKAKGVVHEVNGRKELTVSSISVVK